MFLSIGRHESLQRCNLGRLGNHVRKALLLLAYSRSIPRRVPRRGLHAGPMLQALRLALDIATDLIYGEGRAMQLKLLVLACCTSLQVVDHWLRRPNRGRRLHPSNAR